MKPVQINVCEDETVRVVWEDGKRWVFGYNDPVWVFGTVTRDIKQKPACELNIGDDVYVGSRLC